MANEVTDLQAEPLQPESNDRCTSYRMRILSGADDTIWDEFVRKSPQGNVFLRSDWLRMLRDTDDQGLAELRIGCFDPSGGLAGGWAVPYRSAWKLRVANGFEYFYAGPLLSPELSSPTIHRVKERGEVLSLLEDTIRREIDLLVAETHPSFNDVRTFLHRDWLIAPEYTHLWQFDDPDRLLSGMNREKRREIRRGCESYDFQREDGAPAAFDAFLGLYRKAMNKFGWYPTPAWAEKMRARLDWMQQQDGCRLYTTCSPSGTMLAAVLVLMSREDRTAYLWRMGYDPDIRDNRAVPALYWRAGLDVTASDPLIRVINFGGSPQPNLALFKDYLGATPALHFRLIHRQESHALKAWSLAERAKTAARLLLSQHPELAHLPRLLTRLGS